MRYGYRQPSRFARLLPASGGLALECSYDGGLIADLKRHVPDTARRWDPTRRHWLIDPAHGAMVVDLVMRHLGISLAMPACTSIAALEVRLVQLDYIGAAKVRGGDGEASALGYERGEWRLLFPESVLRAWFDTAEQRPDEHPTLYGVLLAKRDATLEEIRSAYRRMARQWHPDVCREPDGADQFRLIHHAYEVLRDPPLRQKYDAALLIEAATSDKSRASSFLTLVYRPPLRCGWLLVEGVERVGRFSVRQILQWEDVIDEQGRVMVSSWPPGATEPVIVWQ